MNIIDVETLGPILCIDVSTDSTFLVAGKPVTSTITSYNVSKIDL